MTQKSTINVYYLKLGKKFEFCQIHVLSRKCIRLDNFVMLCIFETSKKSSANTTDLQKIRSKITLSIKFTGNMEQLEHQKHEFYE
jgi:hypothetical protein